MYGWGVFGRMNMSDLRCCSTTGNSAIPKADVPFQHNVPIKTLVTPNEVRISNNKLTAGSIHRFLADAPCRTRVFLGLNGLCELQQPGTEANNDSVDAGHFECRICKGRSLHPELSI